MATRGKAIPDHKKHAVFPGYIASSQVRVEGGVIKGPARKTSMTEDRTKYPAPPEKYAEFVIPPKHKYRTNKNV